MKPPHCYVCGLDFQTAPLDRFVLVHFGGHLKMPDNWVGHPSNAVWFCLAHAHLGQERETMAVGVALADIDAVTGGADTP